MSAATSPPARNGAAPSEARLPASLAIVFAAVLNFLLPGKFTLGPPWLFPLVEMALLVPLYVFSPRRTISESKPQQFLAVSLIAVTNAANLASLFLLIRQLLFNPKGVTGVELLYSSVAIWLTNVIVFALWYWELDRGGPDQRMRAELGPPDFLFPQMSTPACARPNWSPLFIDYLYVAFTNATAFSPTDTMPLSAWAKTLMMLQSLAALTTIAIVASRAVNILG